MVTLRLPRCSAPFWPLEAILCYPTSWSPALPWMLSAPLTAQCPYTHLAYSLLSGALAVTRLIAGYSAPSWSLGDVRSFLAPHPRPGALTEGTEW